MQVLLLGRDVTEKNLHDAILKTISNERAMCILEYAIVHPKSAYEISASCNIPLTQVYRWVRKLHELGLVRVSGATNQGGKKYFMYQSKVQAIKITLKEITPQIEIL
jgi:predicted transcriptional regulator